MKTLTLVTKRLYFGIDPVRLREASGRVLARIHGLAPSRASISAADLRRDFGLDTVDGRNTVEAMVADGLLRPRTTAPSEYRVTGRFVEYANARVVDPLPRTRARALVARACELAREINDGWTRNPLEIAALAPFGVYLSREPHLDGLPLGVVLRMRPVSRRARFRMLPKAEGVRDVRAAFEALSSFAQIRLATDVDQLPQPCAIVFQAEGESEV
jgi:hypothetical protein